MEEKLERCLTRILDLTYTVTDDSILAQLEKHLADHIESEEFSHWKDAILLPWCLRVFRLWKSSGEFLHNGFPQRNIKLFVIQVVKILTNDSNDINKILNLGWLNKIIDEVEISQYDLPLIMNYTELMNNVVRHVDGVYWFMDSGAIDLIISEKLLRGSQYLIDTVENLLFNAITVLHKNDIERSFQLIDRIMLPIGLERSEPRTTKIGDLFETAEKYLSTKDERNPITIVEERAKVKNPTSINLLNCLLEMKSADLNLCKLVAEYNLEEWLWRRAFSNGINLDHSDSYFKLIISIKFSKFDNSLEKMDDILLTISYLHRLAFSNGRPGLAYDIMLQCMQLNSQRKSQGLVADCQLDSNLFAFFIIPLQPFCERYSQKHFQSLQFSTRSVVWEYPEIFSNLDIKDKVDVIQSIFKVISRMSNQIDKQKVDILFGIFITMLGTYHRMFQSNDPISEPQEAGIVASCVNYLSSILSEFPNFMTKIISLLEDLFKSQVTDNWRILSETDIIYYLIKIIDFEQLETYVKIKILFLLASILNVLKPTDDPEVNDKFVEEKLYPLSDMLLKYSCHPEWGIRDTVIEVIKSLTIQGQQGFAKTIDLIVDSRFPLFIFNIVFIFNENEDCKISALRCLQKMIQSERIWNDCLLHLNISDKVMDHLNCDDAKDASNSLLRTEHVALIAEIYEAGGISESQIDDVYKQLVYFAVDDLYWEVKVNALKFWKAVMQTVDGQFPSDSKADEQCKSKLAENSETKLMLRNVLKRLNEIGCLQVLWETLNDNCDFVVARVSASILSNLVDILKRYDYLEQPNQEQSTEVETTDVAQNDSCNPDQNTVQDPEPGSETIIVNDVINSIVDARDTELLFSLSTADVSSYDNQHTQIAKRRKLGNDFFTVDEFLSKLAAINLETFIQEKDDWLKSIDGFNALMDTILGFDSTRDESINRIDCY